MFVTNLECAKCGTTYEANKLYNLCTNCGKPLLVRYDLAKAAETLTKESLKTRVSSLWRYREVLPVVKDENIVPKAFDFHQSERLINLVYNN